VKAAASSGSIEGSGGTWEALEMDGSSREGGKLWRR